MNKLSLSLDFIVIWSLELIHQIYHKLKIKCFPILRLKIKFQNRKSNCWKCRYFKGYYFDEMTYDCKKEGTCFWGDEAYCDKS
jgi:hypothetical protein